MASTSFNILVGLACVFSLGGLASLAISFSTDYWLVTTVDRERLREERLAPEQLALPIAFTRNRGLFRTCYEGNETVFLDNEDNVVDGNCVYEKGYELERRVASNRYPDEYDTRIHLLRSHFMLFCVAMLLIIGGLLASVAGCWGYKLNMLRAGAVTMFFAAFLIAGGMALFHGYDYLEREKLDGDEIEENMEDFPAFWDNSAQYSAIAEASKREYSWSYMLGWIAAGLATIGSILFLCGASAYKSPREKAQEKAAEAYQSYANDAYGPVY